MNIMEQIAAPVKPNIGIKIKHDITLSKAENNKIF